MELLQTRMGGKSLCYEGHCFAALRAIAASDLVSWSLCLEAQKDAFKRGVFLPWWFLVLILGNMGIFLPLITRNPQIPYWASNDFSVPKFSILDILRGRSCNRVLFIYYIDIVYF